MIDHRPPLTPRWAASIWSTDAWLYLELPAVGYFTKHTVRFPKDDVGLAQALRLIEHRTSESRIGQPGDLTQWQVDKARLKGKQAIAQLKVPDYDEALVRRPKPRADFSAQARQTAREILRKVGIL